MKVHGRRWFLGLVAGGVWTAGGAPGGRGGCDLGSLMYFLMPDAKEPAGIKQLAVSAEDKKAKTPRVVILTWSGLETRAEFVQADRQLADLLGRQLVALAQDNEEKLTVVS